MEPMNQFIKANKEAMKTYIDQVSVQKVMIFITSHFVQRDPGQISRITAKLQKDSTRAGVLHHLKIFEKELREVDSSDQRVFFFLFFSHSR